MKPTVGVIGLGKLGLSLFSVWSSLGYATIGYDIDPFVREMVGAGQLPPHIKEPVIPKLLACEGEWFKHEDRKRNYKVVDNPAAVARQADVIFIVVPTPSKTNHAFDISYVRRAIKEIIGGMIPPPLAKVIKSNSKTIVIVSTVNPGDMQQLQRLLESRSGLKEGDGFNLLYNPEFIALGNVVNGLTKPDFALIGANEPQQADILRQMYQELFAVYNPKGRTPVYITTPINAELAKLSLNVYLGIKIGFANEIMQLCEKLPGADVDEVLTAVGLDSRVGDKFLRAGPSCHETPLLYRPPISLRICTAIFLSPMALSIK